MIDVWTLQRYYWYTGSSTLWGQVRMRGVMISLKVQVFMSRICACATVRCACIIKIRQSYSIKLCMIISCVTRCPQTVSCYNWRTIIQIEESQKLLVATPQKELLTFNLLEKYVILLQMSGQLMENHQLLRGRWSWECQGSFSIKQSIIYCTHLQQKKTSMT